MRPIEKAPHNDVIGRFREIISDPVNLLIERVPNAGQLHEGTVVLHNGNVVAASGPEAYYGDFSLILTLNRGVHEPLEEYAFQELLKHMPAAPVMVELGAYWAHYSMWMKRARPGSTTILVEPDAVRLEVGKINYERHGYTGEFINSYAARNHWELGDFLQQRDLASVDLLHADIQGGESEMLKCAGDAFESFRVHYCLLSTHSQVHHEFCEQYLSQAGYRIEISSDFDQHTLSHDGLIFASSPRVPEVLSGFEPFGREELASLSPRTTLERLTRALESASR